MKRTIILLGILVGLGCAEKDPEDTGDTDTNGACGAVSTHTLSVVGLVETSTGEPAVSAHVQLDDRGWEPGTVLGEATTDDAGQYRLDDLTITGVENCWGTMLDYVIVAESAESRGEKEINQQLFNAIRDGKSEADLTGFPIVLN